MSRLLTKTLHLATGLRASNSRALSLLASRQSSLSSSSSSSISFARAIRSSSQASNKRAFTSDAFNASSKPSTAVFVARLPWQVDSTRLAKEFHSCGEIVSATVITDRTTGRSKGYGFVEFTTSDGADVALKLDGKEIDGMAIAVNKKQDRQTIRPLSNTLWVGNIPLSTSEESIREILDTWGAKKVSVSRDQETGTHRGFAYLDFETSEDAQAALDEHVSESIDGSPLKLAFKRLSDGVRRGGSTVGRGDSRGGRGDFSGPRRDFSGPRRDFNGGRRDFKGGRGDFSGGRGFDSGQWGRSQGRDF